MWNDRAKNGQHNARWTNATSGPTVGYCDQKGNDAGGQSLADLNARRTHSPRNATGAKDVRETCPSVLVSCGDAKRLSKTPSQQRVRTALAKKTTTRAGNDTHANAG